MTQKNIERTRNALLLGVISAFLVLLLSNVGFLKTSTDALESITLDKRYELRGGLLGSVGKYSKRAGQVVIAKIDPKSLEVMGRFQDWERSSYASLIDSLYKCGATSIGFDVIFSEPSKDVTQDSLLIASSRRSNITFHSLHLSGDAPDSIPNDFIENYAYDFPPEITEKLLTNKNMKIPIIELSDASSGVGNVTLLPDLDGVNRTFPLFVKYAGKVYPAFAFELARHYLGIPKEDIEIELGDYVKIGEKYIPIDKQARMMINYLGDPQETIISHSISDFMTGEINSTNISLEDQIVLIGATAAGLYDLRVTPINKTLPGVYIHAMIIQNILQGPLLIKSGLGFVIFMIIFLSILTAALSSHLKIFKATLSTVILIILYFAFSVYLFEDLNKWLEIVRPTAGILLAFTSTMAFRYVTEERQKLFVKSTFQRYLNPDVVNELMNNPDMLKLGGQRRTMTVLFSDVQGFTTISEMMEPEDLVPFLNEYLTAMTTIVFQYNGTLDKYEGDAIMAFWNAPLNQPNHATLACYAVLDMQKKLAELREKWKAENKTPLFARIGINTGPMIVGNMGSERRFDYTVMGDSVNLGARLEPANKDYGTYLMISQATYDLAKDDIVARELDAIRVKGKLEPVIVYELVAKKDELSPTQKQVLENFDKGLQLYKPEQRKWEEALAYFEKALKIDPEDGPSLEYVKRCRFFIDNPPPKNWDGVNVKTTK